MTSNHSARTPPWLPAWAAELGLDPPAALAALAAADLFGQAEAVKRPGGPSAACSTRPTRRRPRHDRDPDRHPLQRRQRSIGPLGTTARVLVGGLLLASVTWAT
jgi:hypothetical protein